MKLECVWPTLVACVLHGIIAVAVVSTAQAELGWPAGELLLSRSADFGYEDCQSTYPVIPDTVDFYLGARIDLSTIDRADLNGVAAISGWHASAELHYGELVEVELFPSTAVDRDPADLEFDVDLGTTLNSTSSDPILLARLRIARESWTWLRWGAPSGADGSSSPRWDVSESTDDCGAPCQRPFRKLTDITASIVDGRVAICGIDVCLAEVDRPVGGEIWRVGQTQTLLVSASGPYRIEFSPDGGSSWQTLDNGYWTPGFYHWTVPNVVTTQAQIRMATACVGALYSEPVEFSITDKAPLETTDWGALKSRY